MKNGLKNCGLLTIGEIDQILAKNWSINGVPGEQREQYIASG